MKHIIALIMKFIFIAVIMGVILDFTTNLSYTHIGVIAAVVTLVSYFIGDLLILPKTNNTVATIADVLLTAGILIVFNFVYDYAAITAVSVIWAGVGSLVIEWAFHKYMARSVLPAKR